MKSRIIISLSILLLISCNPVKYISKHPELFPPDSVLIVSEEIMHDSVVKFAPDSATIEALFECDSNNNVLIRNLSELSTMGVKTEIVYQDNKLGIQILTDSLSILNRIIEKNKSEKVSKINPVNKKLEKDNKKLEEKVKIRNILLLCAIAIITVLGLIIILIRKL